MTPAPAPIFLIGTWKAIQVEPSRPDLPHPVGGTVTNVQQDDGIHMTSQATWSDGRAVTTTAAFKMDGEWYPVTGSPLADSVSVRRVDDRTMIATLRKGGVNCGTQRVVVSADGRTLTVEADVMAPGGVALSWKTISERV
jgi:hypothetical protein